MWSRILAYWVVCQTLCWYTASFSLVWYGMEWNGMVWERSPACVRARVACLSPASKFSEVICSSESIHCRRVKTSAALKTLYRVCSYSHGPSEALYNLPLCSYLFLFTFLEMRSNFFFFFARLRCGLLLNNEHGVYLCFCFIQDQPKGVIYLKSIYIFF